MGPVVLLGNGRLRVPDAEHDASAGGIAHTTREIDPKDPAYQQLLPLAVPESSRGTRERSAEQADLDAYLAEHAGTGDAMLRLLERQVAPHDTAGDRRAS